MNIDEIRRTSSTSSEFDVGRGWLFLGECDVIVATDEIEGFATQGFGLEFGTKLRERLATRAQITIECRIRHIGQLGQF